MNTRGTKRRKYIGEVRAVLAANIARLQIARYLDSTNRDKALASDVKMSLSQIQRIRTGEIGTSVDQLELLAQHFGVEPWMLLVDQLSPQRIPRLAYDTSSATVRDRVAR